MQKTKTSHQRWKLFAILAFVGLSLVSILGPNVAQASAPKKEGAMANPLSVEITGIVVPVARNRRLVNYAFMSIMVYTADDRSANLVRANMFLVKDAIVRATSRAPIVEDRSAAGFDVMAFARQLYPVVQSSIVGARITRIEIRDPEMMR
ncbi:MAG: hypothetical protein FD163_1095 [Hyphomonadaceae bacterium]|nr:MAG: hypothetical protein FD163_1095 [Hyphomonadaceae bacterium]